MFASNVPNLVDPVMKLTDEVIVWAIIVCAVNVPLTKKSSADDAVAAYEALVALIAYDAVPPNCDVDEPVQLFIELV